MNDKTDTREFRSFEEYLKEYYPRKEKKPMGEDISEFGTRLAEESLELMRELLSDRKISCNRTEGDAESRA